MNAKICAADLLTAYGHGLDALWNGLLSGRSPIAPSQRFSQSGFISNLMAEIPDLHVPTGQSRVMAMLTPLLDSLRGRLPVNTPIILATTVGEIDRLEHSLLAGDDRIPVEASPRHLLGRVKSILGLTGPAMVVSSACASSSAALTRAAAMIRHRQARQVLVITVDSLSEFVYSGFSTLLSLSDTPARPFDAHRNGLTLGEAAAWALVTGEDPLPIDMPGSIEPVRILGWASTTDAVHMTAPHREALGLIGAIRGALHTANIAPSQVDCIAAHGTATLYSDAMELSAFRQTLSRPRPTFSIKGGTGHTLAAAGLVQILVCARALHRGMIPPTVGLQTPDPAAQGWACAQPVSLPIAEHALSTNSGFGGVNTAVVLGKAHQ